VSGAEGLRILFCQLETLLVGAAPAHQARAAGFAKSHTEFDSRRGANERFMNVFDGFDKMRLS